MDLSIIIPMFNEAENAEHTLARVEESLASFQGDYEIIAVNDGSTDNTLEVLQRIAKLNQRIRVVSYSRNIGRGMALRAGFKEARGEIMSPLMRI